MTMAESFRQTISDNIDIQTKETQTYYAADWARWKVQIDLKVFIVETQ